MFLNKMLLTLFSFLLTNELKKKCSFKVYFLETIEFKYTQKNNIMYCLEARFLNDERVPVSKQHSNKKNPLK